MKHFGLGLLLLTFSFPLFAQEKEQRQKVNGGVIRSLYDKFQDKTFVTVTAICDSSVPSIGFLDASAVYSGRKVSGPIEFITLSIETTNREWTFLKLHNWIALVDNERLQLRSTHGGKVVRGGVEERVVTTIPYQTFQKFVNAQSLEFQVGAIEMRMNKKGRAALKDFLSLLEGQLAPNFR